MQPSLSKLDGSVGSAGLPIDLMTEKRNLAEDWLKIPVSFCQIVSTMTTSMV
jgi:hypothetical protein